MQALPKQRLRRTYPPGFRCCLRLRAAAESALIPSGERPVMRESSWARLAAHWISVMTVLPLAMDSQGSSPQCCQYSDFPAHNWIH